jgi:hypothetical protein
LALSDSTVRNFRQGDLPFLKRLYKNVSTKSFHFVRDESFLRYFMDYPGVDKQGIFVVQGTNEITGFAIVSVTEEMGLRQGKILELQVNDAFSMRALIRVALDYCKHRDVDTVMVVPPLLEEPNEILKDWIKFETGVMMTRILSVPSVLKALLSSEEIRNSYAKLRIVFHVGDEIVEAKITPELVEVNPLDSEPEEADLLVRLSFQTLLKIVFHRANPYLGYLTGRIRVRVMRNTLRLLKLLNMMRLTTPLHVSLLDRM